ncbi:hypothetical protein AVEN_82672-1 [Araneus ventricosus]|uniref:Uncharacterized protein n=1 Tax=Araneus ventricosus TaxID=182803 RepID=A0A4Y2PXH6_ARAVE|nr:hypothetical protein AVEN_82672-1 [Araneus ventricosus]
MVFAHPTRNWWIAGMTATRVNCKGSAMTVPPFHATAFRALPETLTVFAFRKVCAHVSIYINIPLVWFPKNELFSYRIWEQLQQMVDHMISLSKQPFIS